MRRKTFFVLFTLFAVLLGGITPALAANGTADLEQRSDFVAPIMIVNTSFLNIRTGPGAEYTVLLTVVGGTELPVLGVASDFVWYQVSTVAGIGWINSEFGIPRGSFANVPTISREEIRALAVQAAANQDTLMESSDDATGSAGFSSGREWGISIIENHPARSAATINSSSPGTMVANANIIYTVLQATNADGIVWYRINDSTFGSVWVEAPKTAFRPFACGDISAVIMTSSVRPTRGPDGSGTLDGNLNIPEGAEAYLLDFVEGQFKVELLDGNTGWINAADADVRRIDGLNIPFCTNPRPTRSVDGGSTNGAAPSGPTLSSSIIAIINTAFLNVRSGPGAQFTVVTTLSGGTRADVIGVAPDGVWYLIEGNFGEGWVNASGETGYIIFRGDGSRLPVIRNYTGSVLNRPIARITDAVTLYAAPNVTLGTIGALSGVLEDLPVVARTEDFTWVQLNTALGFGWVRTNEIELSGDTTTIPVAGG